MERIKIFINGCFDLFHSGHKYFIFKSLDIIRPKDILVAINTDESVEALKGQNRPAVPLCNRADSVQRCIDKWSQDNLMSVKVLIKPFTTEGELAKLIDEFEPTAIVKGNDRPDTRDIVGADKWPTIIIPRLYDNNGHNISTLNIFKEHK
jgi:cytidyltransferase-like protein